MEKITEDLNKPRYLELILLLITSFINIVIKCFWTKFGINCITADNIEHIFNISASLLWGMYIIWRMISVRGITRVWGLRLDNFLKAMHLSLLFAVPATLILLILGCIRGCLHIPIGFWITFLLYPIWGVVQQFALQVLLNNNLRQIVKTTVLRAAIATLLFSIAHIPNVPLMILVLPFGFVSILIYERHPNIWALGIIHGCLGALAYYLILGQDPGAQILNFILSHFPS